MRTTVITLPSSRRVRHTYDLLVNLVLRDFRSRYTDSALGLFWAVLNPLAQLSIYYFIFQQVLSLGIRRYSSFLFVGLIAWAWFSASINNSVSVLKSSRDTVEQPGFPASILPVVSVSMGMIDFMIALPILMLIAMLEGTSPLSVALLALPLVMAVQFAFTLGLALLFAGVNAAFRDTRHLVLLFLQLYLFLTPIFYDVSSVPARYRPFFELNPMLHIVEAYRAVLMHGGVPQGAPLAYVALLSLGIIAIGVRVYEWARYRYLEEL